MSRQASSQETSHFTPHESESSAERRLTPWSPMALGPVEGPLRRCIRLILVAVAVVLGVVSLMVLPAYIWVSTFEIRLFFRNPILRFVALAALLIFGPRRIVGWIPRRGRGRLADWARRCHRWRPIVEAAPAAHRAILVLAATLRGRLAGLDPFATRVLGGPSTAVTAAACALLLLAWIPHYLTWPWWADTDQFAVAAQFWDAGVAPFGDLEDFDFPGPIYVHYLLGKAFGWGRTAPFNAADAAFVAFLGVALAAWSRRVFRSALPGLLSFLAFLCSYLGYDFSQVAQRDWHAPFFAVVGLFALEAWPGRAGRLASALAMAAALAFRPHVVVFLPALASAVDEGGRRDEEPWGRAILPLLEWSAFLAASLVLAFGPLILEGVLDDFVRSVQGASHREYNRISWFRFVASLSRFLQDRPATLWLAALILMSIVGPAASRRLARTWALALLGVICYKPISPFPHAYLDQPMRLVRALTLAPLVAWPLASCRLPASLRLAAVLTLLASAQPRTSAEYCSASRSLEALGPLARGEDPAVPPPGCIREFSSEYYPNEHYRWEDYRRALAYLRGSTPPRARVANLLWDFPYPTINGPAGRLTPFPAAGGYNYLATIAPDLLDRYIEILERERDVIVVWGPGKPIPGYPRRSPLQDGLERAVRRSYRPEARFGLIEVWRHRDVDGPGPATPEPD